MKSLKISFLAVMLAGIAMLCSCTENSDPEPKDEEPDNEILLSTDATLGNIITDGAGVTLYFFSNDVSGESACLDGCLSKWPIFYLENPEFGTGLDAADFGTITHTNGEMQTTYKGWPLYYFSPAGDGTVEEPGATGGEGIGSIWYTAKPDYSIMIASGQLVGHDGVNYTADLSPGDGATAYFVDAEGNTLYSFSKDYFNENTFTNPDFGNNGAWPIYEEEVGALPSTLSSADFGTIDVNGRTQITYKGWPLYHFGQDASRGETKGVSFPAAGIWPYVNSTVETAPQKPTVGIYEHETLGSVLVDGDGQILYVFTKDVAGESACAGGCLNSWPIFFESEITISNSSQVELSDFGVITRGDGAMQTTYKGWPLYYYAPGGDGEIETAGEANGEGVGSVWYVAKDYDLMIADAQLVGSNGTNYLSDYTEGTGSTTYFTDAEGNTLYIFINDAKDTNNYTNEDFSNNGSWPIYHVEITSLPSGMSAEDFGEIEVHGEKQLTFKGWPVYYFGGDSQRGDNKGVSVPSPGVWPIINNDTDPAI
ncbi:MAG: hypothetical protein RIC35_10280 [Marinoscillum sp.]